MKTARARLSFNSVRVRLTLWNVAVLAFALIAAGVAFSLTIQANVRQAVDHRLSQRARRMQHFVSNPLPFPHDPPRNGPLSFLPSHPPRGEDATLGELPPRFFDPQGRSVPTGIQAWDPQALGRALRGAEVYSTVQSGNDTVRVFSVPLQRNGKTVAAAQYGNSLRHIQEEFARTARTLITLIPLVLLFAGLGGAFLTERALRPIRQITQAAGKIEAENLSRRLPVQGHDELADLAETFNGMLARLQSDFERQQRFTADASHELRTPLTIIKANTSLALTGERTAQELQKTIRTVDGAADRMNRIVQDLLLLARSDTGELAYTLVPTPLSETLTQAAAAFPGTDHAPISLSLPPSDILVEGDAHALIRLFGNLLENAIRHTPPEGRITVTAESQGSQVVVEVSDTGEGIAPEHLSHVTERFYRVEAARSRTGGGTGLGLAICRSIAEAHGGSLAVESAVAQGTTVRVTLLRAENMG